ncbi:cytochrome-c oxidase, cbb3-type subunit II [Chiayiivirga flava]|uniref:Cytochrome c oxidase cbb3-type subunit 2 n=1 Tax=Chiayiivirga flava TaxID=659595 RepID=A0A7W8D372_9GAMM|nr:cytochrome-c oxidase, cbb3-type subunit II [Chiayiivirga flava]MBB5207118.1 cytochrome c oxidase cbb3-type subunit 2 [Chiayiivirga flava]
MTEKHPAAHNQHAHEKLEKNVGLMAMFIALAVSFGGLAEIVPLMYQAEAIEPLPGVKPYPALELAGRDIYVREGCYNCHSQMIRTLRFETERYGHYSLAGESVYDRPFQWGSKRTGPDLARVGGRYSDDWHRVHLTDPRAVVPESNMPSFPWLADAAVSADEVTSRMRALQGIGDPYTDQDIDGAAAAVAGRSELDAVVAYLQGLGKHVGPTYGTPGTGAPVDDTTQAAAPASSGE